MYLKQLFLSLLYLAFFTAEAQNKSNIDSLKSLLSTAKSDTSKVNIYNYLGIEYFFKDFDSSSFYFNKAIHIAQKVNDKKYKARTFVNIGANYYHKEEYLKSLEYLDLAYNIANENNLPNILANTHFIKAAIFLDIDRLNLANEHLNKATAIYEEQENNTYYNAICILHSSIYESLGDFKKSIKYQIKGYENAIRLNKPKEVSANLNNLGNLYRKLNKPDSAKMYILKAVALNKEHKNMYWLATNYSNLCNIMLYKNKVDSAEWYINEALKIYNEGGYNLNSASLLSSKVKVALHKKDTISAIKYCDSIILLSQDFEGIKDKIFAYKNLYEIAHAQKRYESAINYYKFFNTFDDSLKKETNSGLLTIMDLQMEYADKSNKLKLENKEMKLVSQQKSIYLFIAVGLLFLLILTIYFVYRLQRAKSLLIRKEKQHIEDELELKKREMTANVMALLKRNEILNKISKELLEIEKTAVKGKTKEAISQVSSEIKKSMDVELWEEFDIRFRQVHHEFHTNLLRKFPDLSPNEQRICAFLRMNMSTKDISELTGLDKRTVDNTRYKIRKKLNLDSKSNLITFLAKI